MNKGRPIRIIANFLTETLNTKKAERHCHLDFYSHQSYVITEGESKPFCNKKQAKGIHDHQDNLQYLQKMLESFTRRERYTPTRLQKTTHWNGISKLGAGKQDLPTIDKNQCSLCNNSYEYSLSFLVGKYRLADKVKKQDLSGLFGISGYSARNTLQRQVLSQCEIWNKVFQANGTKNKRVSLF